MKQVSYRIKRTAEWIAVKTLDKICHRMNAYSLEHALARCQNRGTMVNTVIDVGASDGRWSLTASKFFPSAFYYMIDANAIHQPALEKLKQRWSQCDYVLAAASDDTGEIYFEGHEDPWGGVAVKQQRDQMARKVSSVTIDHVVTTGDLKPPYLIKLDTHGFEVPIFEGAAKALQQTNLIVVEAYNFDIAPGSLRFGQMCDYLEQKGFRCVDFCDPMFRPTDRAFWQIDLFFMPANSDIFRDNSYRGNGK